MVTHNAHARSCASTARLALGLALLLVASACEGGSSPTEPELPPAGAGSSRTVDVGGETVRIDDEGCGGLDYARIRGELSTALRRAEGENPAAASTGYAPLHRVVFRPGVPTGHYRRGSLELTIGCGNYGAVEHEPGHFWGDVLGLPCWREVWHSRDLRCS